MLELRDGATKVVLNAAGMRGKNDEALNNLLDYVVWREAKSDEFVKELDAAVGRVITAEEWRLSYVKLSILRQEWQEEAREEGRAEGREEGRVEGRAEGLKEGLKKGFTEGEGKFAALVKRLIAEGKSDAIEKVTDDKNFRRELYDLYGIN